MVLSPATDNASLSMCSVGPETGPNTRSERLDRWSEEALPLSGQQSSGLAGFVYLYDLKLSTTSD